MDAAGDKWYEGGAEMKTEMTKCFVFTTKNFFCLKAFYGIHHLMIQKHRYTLDFIERLDFELYSIL